MSKGYRDGAFALGLVVGGGIALNLFLWLDYKAEQPCDTDSPSCQQAEYSEIGSKWDGLIGTFVSPSDTLAQWIMAFFTIAATIVLLLTLKSANKTNVAAIEAANSANQANEIMRRSQRPWVMLKECKSGKMVNITLDGGKTVKNGLMIQPHICNVGKSPASEVYIHYKSKITSLESGVPIFEIYDSEHVAPRFLTSGEAVHGYILFDDEEARRIMEKSCKVYIYVRVRYKVDSFNSDSGFSETEACLQANYIGGNREIDGKPQQPFDYLEAGMQNKAT